MPVFIRCFCAICSAFPAKVDIFSAPCYIESKPALAPAGAGTHERAGLLYAVRRSIPALFSLKGA